MFDPLGEKLREMLGLSVNAQTKRQPVRQPSSRLPSNYSPIQNPLPDQPSAKYELARPPIKSEAMVPENFDPNTQVVEGEDNQYRLKDFNIKGRPSRPFTLPRQLPDQPDIGEFKRPRAYAAPQLRRKLEQSIQQYRI